MEIKEEKLKTYQSRQIIIILISFALLIFAVGIYLYFRKKKQLAQEQTMRQVGSLKMESMRGRLSPHFLFNVLNNKWSSFENDKESSRHQFENLTLLIRKSLTNTDKVAIPLSEEIAFVKSYIELQKCRMDNELTVNWNVDHSIEEMQVPGMILQIPVENAIKHGLSPKKENRVLIIDISKENEYMLLQVTDNGIGRSRLSITKGTGTGMKVLNSTIYLLNQINDKKMSMKIIDDEPGAINKLKEVLQSIPRPKLDVVFTCTDPIAGYRKTLEYLPDILFLDINMPGKSGIELLRELKDHSEFDCYVVFQTAYQQYILQALREAAFDFFHKPVKYADVVNMVNRYLNIEYGTGFREKIDRILIEGNKRISLPTTAGLQFFQENEIVACEYIKHEKGVKPYWAVFTIDSRKIMLRRNIKGQNLLEQLQNDDFYLINSGTIINLNFLSMVDYKNRLCVMVPPFENSNYVIARAKLSEFKERFDKIV